jgi:hypothetical protein
LNVSLAGFVGAVAVTYTFEYTYQDPTGFLFPRATHAFGGGRTNLLAHAAFSLITDLSHSGIFPCGAASDSQSSDACVFRRRDFCLAIIER